MAAAVLPDSSNFLGVALVVNRSRDGPRFVFHYPPSIVPARERTLAARRGAGTAGAATAADELDDDDNDVLLEHFTRPANGTISREIPGSDRLNTNSGSSSAPWEHVAGFPTKDLESLLTPSRAFHKKLFQVSLDQLYFVSYPVYVPESGIWKSKRRRKKKDARSQTQISVADETWATSGEQALRPVEKATTWESQTSLATDASHEEAESGHVAGFFDEKDELDKEEKKSGMTMFNVVFILNPKKHEASELIDTLYSHIIKKINKAYKYSQERSDFMWKESKGILALKDKGRESSMLVAKSFLVSPWWKETTIDDS